MVLGPVDPEKANKMAQDLGSQSPLSAQSVKEGVPEFTKERKFHSFKADHALIEGDVIIHFYLPQRAMQYIKGDNNPAEQKWMEFWLKKFPAVIDPIAREYFDAEYPRLQVKYTQEVASWWFKGQGYGNLLDLKKFVKSFLEKLDAALQAGS